MSDRRAALVSRHSSEASRAGTNRWLELGVGTFQPGEIAKIGVVLFLAKYFSGVRKDQLGTPEVLVTGAFAGIPLAL